MNIDTDKIDDMVLALMSLGFVEDKICTRAWKSFNWECMNRLYEKGFIHDPVSKTKSVIVTSEGVEKAKKLFNEIFLKN